METDDPLGNVYSADKEERINLIDQAVVKAREVYLEAGARTAKDIENLEIDEPVVRLAVNRFIRQDLASSKSEKEPGITLVVCHANGFHKEMWEETLRAFLAYNKAGGTQIKIDEIWALDFANQGESFRLNGGRIGPVASWADCVNTEDQNVPVTLACPRWAEAAVFTDWHGLQAGYDKLPFLDKNLKVRFIMAGDPSATGGAERTRLMVWRPPTAENIILTEASHLVTQEKPDILGEQLWRSLMELPLGPPNTEKQVKAKL
ncbi:hypothetical protein QFC19_007758 [Naganishia cerealis]|uniref:Uncharacterized protein n=1 Tax=Naganishia cerealis TaxID=610337 RepID=A0ACC2V7H5_9TREE|nr:hypothetical protein QFC19_007758 [Naganishia cerealis]